MPIDYTKAAAQGEVTINGVRLNATGRVMQCYREIEAAVVARRGSIQGVIERASSSMRNAPDLFEIFCRAAIYNERSWGVVTMEEFGGYLKSVDGIIIILWLMTRDCNPNHSVKITRDYIESLVMEDLQEALMKKGATGFEEASDKMSTQVDGLTAEGNKDLKNSCPPATANTSAAGNTSN